MRDHTHKNLVMFASDSSMLPCKQS